MTELPEEVTVEEVTVEEGRALFDDAARKELGVSGDEFLRRYDANDIPLEWPPHRVCQLAILIPFGRPAPTDDADNANASADSLAPMNVDELWYTR